MFKRFNQPFPDKADLKESLLTIVYVGIFVGLFLFLIRPFSIEGPWFDLAWASVGFGAVTVVFGWTFELAARFVFKVKTHGPNWTLGKWILMSIILVVWIAVGNYLFVNILSDWRAMGYFSFVRMIGYTSLIGIFPVALSGIVIQLQASQRNEQAASDIEGYLHTSTKEVVGIAVTLEAENGQALNLNVSDVRYVEAMQNYVTVWFLKDGKLQKEILRSTIGAIEEQFNRTDVIRCHRSYLVNVDSIEKVAGNAQGLRLQLKSVTEVEVPVSRSFIPKVRELLG